MIQKLKKNFLMRKKECKGKEEEENFPKKMSKNL